MIENETFVTGLTTENDPEPNLEELETSIAETVNEKTQLLPRNRAERRALAKKMGKKGRKQYDSTTKTIGETAKKLDYINLIQKLRELNDKKEKENEENEATED